MARKAPSAVRARGVQKEAISNLQRFRTTKHPKEVRCTGGKFYHAIIQIEPIGCVPRIQSTLLVVSLTTEGCQIAAEQPRC
jgi:hypothetical protein